MFFSNESINCLAYYIIVRLVPNELHLKKFLTLHRLNVQLCSAFYETLKSIKIFDAPETESNSNFSTIERKTYYTKVQCVLLHSDRTKRCRESGNAWPRLISAIFLRIWSVNRSWKLVMAVVLCNRIHFKLHLRWSVLNGLLSIFEI